MRGVLREKEVCRMKKLIMQLIILIAFSCVFVFIECINQKFMLMIYRTVTLMTISNAIEKWIRS